MLVSVFDITTTGYRYGLKLSCDYSAEQIGGLGSGALLMKGIEIPHRD